MNRRKDAARNKLKRMKVRMSARLDIVAGSFLLLWKFVEGEGAVGLDFEPAGILG